MKTYKKDINEDLIIAVEMFDLSKVKECLENGADPNYRRYEDNEGHDDLIQPTTSLRMVMFRISDCMLEDDDLKQFAEIAKLLLKFGADPKPAMDIAEVRYGKYLPDMEINPFTKVWHIIANYQIDSK